MPAFTDLSSFLGCARVLAEELHHRKFPLPGDRPHYAPTRRIDVTHYKLDIRLDFARRAIAGRATLTVRSLADRLTTPARH